MKKIDLSIYKHGMKVVIDQKEDEELGFEEILDIEGEIRKDGRYTYFVTNDNRLEPYDSMGEEVDFSDEWDYWDMPLYPFCNIRVYEGSAIEVGEKVHNDDTLLDAIEGNIKSNRLVKPSVTLFDGKITDVKITDLSTGEVVFKYDLTDNVSKPDYYLHSSGVRCEEISAHLAGPLMNAFKYIFRCGFKDPKEKELKKALSCLRMLEEEMKQHADFRLFNSEQYSGDVQCMLIDLYDNETGFKKVVFQLMSTLSEREDNNSENLIIVDLIIHTIEKELNK